MSAPLSDPGSLSFIFLGFPQVFRGSDLLIGGRFDRTLALLAHLAASCGPRPRGELASLLWPDKSFKAARANLSTTLYNLEHRLGEGFVLEKTFKTVEWKESSLPWEEEPVDLRRYLREDPPPGCPFLHSPEDCPRCRERIESRREMGRRLFLEGVSFDGMGHYGAWVESFRKPLALLQEKLGRQLSSQGTSPSFVISSPLLPGREVRQITLLSVLLSSAPGADPEETVGLREVFRERIEPVVRAAGGELRPGPGGSLLAVFGLPRTLEDGARWGVKAARDIGALALSDPRFRAGEIRLALHTGEGLSDLGGGDPDPVGERIREVDRIVRRGAPGEITATWETVRLIDRLYVVLRSGVIPEGPEGPERLLYRIREERNSFAGPEIALVGRKSEQSRMERLLGEAKKGRRLRTLWITGEAGIGKSALLGSFANLVGRREGEGSVRQIFCLSEYREGPYSSVIRFLRRYVGLEEGLSGRETRYRLERYLLSAGQSVEKNLPFLSHLLCGPTNPVSEEISDLSPEELRDGIESLILSILTWRSERPFLLAIEDLHWMDMATQGLLRKAIDALRERPVLLVTTAREEGVLREMGLSAPDEIFSLGRLTRAESRQMIESLASEVPSPPALREALDRGGGVPLYLRELVLTGALAGRASGVPPTLKDLLASRFGALKESRVMARVAACLGQSVDWPLLLRATERYAGLPSGGRTADRWIGELVENKILVMDRPPPDPVYEFRHALLRETVLESLPGSVRRGIHSSLVKSFREDFPDRAERQPEVLGEHLILAGEPEEAFSLFVRAGERASNLGAYRIALVHFEQALGLLGSGEKIPETQAQELRILLDMVKIAIMVWGHGSPEVARLSRKAQDLASGDPDSPRKQSLEYMMLGVGSGLYGPSWILERVGPRGPVSFLENPGLDFWVACVRASALFWSGDLSLAFSELEALRSALPSLRLPDSETVGSHSEPPAVLLHSYLGFTGQLMGRIRESREALEQGSRLDDCLRFPKSRVFVGVLSTYSECMAKNAPAAERKARETLKLAEEFGLHLWEEVCRLALFWCEGSKPAEKEAEVTEKEIRGMLPGVSPIFVSLHAETALAAGLWEKAIDVARFGREEARRTGTRVFDPLFRIVEGKALLGIDPQKGREGAQRLFEEAGKEAEGTGALWYALLAELELVSIGSGETKKMAGLLGRLSGGEDLDPVKKARRLLG